MESEKEKNNGTEKGVNFGIDETRSCALPFITRCVGNLLRPRFRLETHRVRRIQPEKTFVTRTLRITSHIAYVPI